MALYTPTRDFSIVSDLDAYSPVLPNVAHVLTRVCVQGDMGSRPLKPSIWDTAVPASVAIQDYLVRLCKHGFCSNSVWVIVCALIDRWSASTGRSVTSYNVHKLVLTCFVLAVKLRDDSFYSIEYYGKVGGVSKQELFAMEQVFLLDIDFNLEFGQDAFAYWIGSLRNVTAEPEGAGSRAQEETVPDRAETARASDGGWD
eukprot:TRINITY_DN47969_c0_g1_i1.p1 TRINITY_DN47969_c0_g1~~TRINITY_DN47969_c0_g1_i1.p1  ORF type:complete len:200 (+),score=44.33 TRINITY_DN47969_c0_g1_i1:103-702(+)